MRVAGRCAVTVLRPTIVYGGPESALTRIAALARRWRVFPLPRGATGLRQPVHCDDLADAALAALASEVPGYRCFDLPGGETLDYREMVARVLRAAAPDARVIGVPDAPWRAAATAWSALSGRGPGRGAIARLAVDLVFDHRAAARELSYAPRRFAPTAADLGAAQHIAPQQIFD